jgi:hypothetical protein
MNDIFHSMPRHNKKCKHEKFSSSQGVLLWSIQNSVVCVGKKFACHPWKCKDDYSITKKRVLVGGGVEKWWQAGWDTIWSRCSTDWTWHYMGVGQDRGERRTVLTSHPEGQPGSSKGPEICVHMDARSCQWMVVIMNYDMADYGRCIPDRRRENPERRTRHTHHLR